MEHRTVSLADQIFLELENNILTGAYAIGEIFTETVISKQMIRSATSIGANANEAIYGQSKADFMAKLQISLKETAETEYWLRLLVLSEYISNKEGESLLDDCLEIKKILISTLNTAKENK